MDFLVLLHIFAISFWFGVISVEFIFERARIDRGAKVLLHKLTDRYSELPVVLLILVSGLLLWSRASWSIELLPKVSFGLLAVGSNVVCYCFVERRTEEKAVFKRESSRIGWATVFAAIGIIGAVLLAFI